MENKVSRYGRWEYLFDSAQHVDRVELSAPSGKKITRLTFDHQPVRFMYDHHGFEQMVAVGPMRTAVRYTPQECGKYQFIAFCGERQVEAGYFECVPSDHPGYVTISKKDPRYFSLTNGEPYCAIGLNLCAPPFYPLPQGMQHFLVDEEKATIGLREYRRWFRLLAENGGNFARIWLSNPYFQTETEVAGEVNPILFNRLDGVVELAREYHIRLKLCFDHFRAFESNNPVTQTFFLRRLVHPADGRSPSSLEEWLSHPDWQDLWFKKVQAYLVRYGGDPVVMAWELWNEMDCVETNRWELVREWTKTMLRRIKEQEPDQLVVNSLGSFDEERKSVIYNDFMMNEMDFQQVHRYLDQGAPLKICTLDPVALSIDAVQRARRPDKPILLAETGAVNDRHTGPFRYYRMDRRGIIFHDTTFPAFFAGAAGTGQNWFWDSYVDQKDLWEQFRPFVDLIQGIALDREAFQIMDLSDSQAWCLALNGSSTLLVWVRNRADSWDLVLRDEVEPVVLGSLHFQLPIPAYPIKRVQVFPAWHGTEPDLKVQISEGYLEVTGLHYAVMVRADYY